MKAEAERDAARREAAGAQTLCALLGAREAERDAAQREELVVRLCGQERDLGDARHERDTARREAAEAQARVLLAKELLRETIRAAVAFVARAAREAGGKEPTP